MDGYIQDFCKHSKYFKVTFFPTKVLEHAILSGIKIFF